MNLIRCLAIGAVLFSLASLAAEAGGEKKAQDLVVGKWIGEAKVAETLSITMEFFRDGNHKATIKVGDKSQTVKGTYKLIDETTLELAPLGENEKPRRVAIEKLTEEVLILDDMKLRIEFKRGR